MLSCRNSQQLDLNQIAAFPMRGCAHSAASNIALVSEVHQEQQDGADVGVVFSRVVLVAVMQQVHHDGHEGVVRGLAFGQQFSMSG